MFFRRRKKIQVNIKLLAGLDQKAGYDAEKGIQVEIRDKSRLKRLIKEVGLPRDQPIAFLVNGEKARPGDRLADGDEVFCFLPFAGG